MTTPGPDARDARARSFGSVAAGYAALRPTYPADAVAFLLGRGGALDVVDVGAGTGLPAVATVVGTAEQLPAEDASADAVVAGQAAHWFDPAPAARELRRVLRPGGRVGLVWNTRDERVPWVAALGERIADEARGTRPTAPSSSASRGSSRPTSRSPSRRSCSGWAPRTSSPGSPPGATSR